MRDICEHFDDYIVSASTKAEAEQTGRASAERRGYGAPRARATARKSCRRRLNTHPLLPVENAPP
jgi:hypothetical protein